MSRLDNGTQEPERKFPVDPIPATSAVRHDPYQALRFRDFRLFFFGTIISAIGGKMIEIALGWELYMRTGSALVLGIVGLMLVLPVIFFSLLAGHLADNFNRKSILLAAQSLLALSALALTLLSVLHGPLLFIYVSLLAMGTATAFTSPASSALFSQTVAEEAFENAATWNSSAWQLATVIGPALGGVVIALFDSATFVYIFDAIAALTFIIIIASLRVKPRPLHQQRERATFRSLGEGIAFLRRTPVLLAAITLDLFAVLLGGATTLLPIYASDILHVGPVGLGLLRAAPAVGGIGMAFLLAYLPPFKRAGHTLLLAVLGFGIATIIFGLSHSFWLSSGALFTLGALDNVSVVIRATLMLTRVPNQMRGRISAVNAVFIGGSNELGGFESGVTAQLFGPLWSVVGGGIGTILVVVLVALIWPEMRRLSTLSASKNPDS